MRNTSIFDTEFPYLRSDSRFLQFISVFVWRHHLRLRLNWMFSVHRVFFPVKNRGRYLKRNYRYSVGNDHLFGIDRNLGRHVRLSIVRPRPPKYRLYSAGPRSPFVTFRRSLPGDRRSDDTVPTRPSSGFVFLILRFEVGNAPVPNGLTAKK